MQRFEVTSNILLSPIFGETFACFGAAGESRGEAGRGKGGWVSEDTTVIGCGETI